MSDFKNATIRDAAKPAEFAGFKFKVKPLTTVADVVAMRQCARLFVADPERDGVREELAFLRKRADLEDTIELIGIDPEAEPEKLLFVFNNWQSTRLALCVVTAEANTADLLEMIRENPEFRQLIHDTATGKKTPPAQAEADAKNA